jgi:DNA invertase Pin-like site-specific DNA recombinase
MSKKKAVGYVRVSTEEQSTEGASLGAQEAKVRAYCALHELELVGIERDSASGKSLERPGISSALALVRSGAVSELVVFKLDRLTRAPKDLFALVEEFKEGSGRHLHSVSEKLDTSSANGRFFVGILGLIASWEREMISERTRFALRHLKAQGKHIARPRWKTAVGADGYLVEDKDRAGLIAQAKRLRRDGLSIRKIAERFRCSVGLAHRLATWHGRHLTLKRATPAPVNGSDDNGLQGGAVHEGVGL